MSTSPITPSKPIVDQAFASPHAPSSTHKGISSTKSVISSVNEPSPASTYGETVRSSVPMTPAERSTQGVIKSFPVARLDPVLKSMTGSPMHGTDLKHRQSTTHQVTHVKFDDGLPSPSQAAVMSKMDRPSPVHSSPSVGNQAFRIVPAWHGGRDGNPSGSHQQGSDDPFISSDEDSRLRTTGQPEPLTQHPDKAGLTPTNNTAQAIYSPQACVFVANLSQSESDEQLEHSVTQTFQQFGNVYVKIRRDARQMPFAFAQYTNVEDAQRAITLGRGMLINGRACRTEVARVNRSLYLSKINGGTLIEMEARDIMKTQGPIETIWSASQTEREMFGLPEGLFIRFAFFDDCRDAIAHFRDSDIYRLEQVKGLDETRATPVRGIHSLTSPFRRDSPGRLISPYAARRNVDARSIFVGNIPANLAEEHLSNMFQPYGRVLHIEIIRKPSMINGVNTFAFIEYEHPQAAAVAVQAGPRVFQGLHLRIEHKESTQAGSRAGHGFGGSPRRNEVVESQEFLAAFQRGVSVGMSQAAQTLLPAPYYGQYPYYPAYEAGATLPNMTSSTSQKESSPVNNSSYGNAYMNHIAAQYSYAPTTANVGHFDSTQSYPSSCMGPAHYQWPVSGIPYDESMHVTGSQELQ